MRRILPLALALVAGCQSWRSSNVSPAATLGDKPPTEIRVTTASGRQTVHGPSIAGDSLIGATHGASTTAGRYAVPLQDVQRIEVRRVDAVKTIALLGGVALTTAAFAAAASSGNGGGSDGTHPSASCPMVYSWDGTHWRLDSGTFGGAISRGLQRMDVDNLEHAFARDGQLRLRVTNELRETDHVDALGVTLVEHAPGITVAPDHAGEVHGFRAVTQPVSAVDYRGRDALAHVRGRDERVWISRPAGRDSARAADVRDGLELAFVRPAGARVAHLVMDGNNTLWATYLLSEFISAHGAATAAWYDSLDTDPALARRAFAPLAREGFLTASVRTGGGWRTVGQYWEAGPEIAKEQVLHLSLRGVEGDTVHVRLESAPAFWLVDRVGMAFGPDEPVRARELPMVAAVRGDGGDAAGNLAGIDGRYLTLETGEHALVTFAAPQANGAERSFLLHSTGWYRVRTAERGRPAVAFLDRLATEPLALSKAAVAKLNSGLASLRPEPTP
jgi:hypothetical protein